MTDFDLADALTNATQAALAGIEDLVGPLSDAYDSVIRAAGRRTARLFRSKAQALTADATFVPPDEDEVAGTAQTSEAMKAEAAGAQRDAADAVVEAFAAEGISYDVGAVFTEDMLEAVGERATFAADEAIRETYREVIAVAADDGWSVNRTAETIVETIDGISRGRADALARTDLNGLANAASVRLAALTRDPDQTLYKRWLATNDERTRDTHADANGQSVLVNESFHVGFATLSAPGDPLGPPEEVMNCRCTVIYSSTREGTAVTASAPLVLPTSALARAMPTTELQAVLDGREVVSGR